METLTLTCLLDFLLVAALGVEPGHAGAAAGSVGFGCGRARLGSARTQPRLFGIVQQRRRLVVARLLAVFCRLFRPIVVGPANQGLALSTNYILGEKFDQVRK